MSGSAPAAALAASGRYIVLGDNGLPLEVTVSEFSPSSAYVRLQWADSDMWQWRAVESLEVLEFLPAKKDG